MGCEGDGLPDGGDVCEIIFVGYDTDLGTCGFEGSDEEMWVEHVCIGEVVASLEVDEISIAGCDLRHYDGCRWVCVSITCRDDRG